MSNTTPSTSTQQVKSTVQAGPDAPAAGRSRMIPGGVDALMRFGLLILFGLVVLFFAIDPATSPTYLTSANLTTLLGNQVVTILVAMGALAPLSAGYIDLSVGAITGVSSITSAELMTTGHTGVIVAVAAGVAIGIVLGAVNGVLIARFNLASIIVTLGTSTALSGAMLWYTGGNTVGNNLPEGFTNFGSLSVAGLPRIAWVMIPVVIVCWFVLENTPFGRYLQAIASNRRSAHLVGIPVERTAFGAFVVAGFLAGIAGVLLTARSGAADSTTGPSFLFPALTAVFLGATAIYPGRPNVLGTIVGIFFIAFALSGLALIGASTWAPDLFEGLLLVISAFVAIQFARRRGGGPRML